MSYQTNQDLPLEVRDRLSEVEQNLYRAAFNSALHWYGEESKAHEVAQYAIMSQDATLKSGVSKSLESFSSNTCSLF
jgi:cation transport regulator